MERAIPWPCSRPKSKVRKINKSSVPWRSASRSFSSWVDIWHKYALSWVRCQQEKRLAFQNLPRKSFGLLRYSCVSRFLETAQQILEAAENVMLSGEAPSEVAILLGAKSGIHIVMNSDWPLDSLQREHGAESAYRVSGSADRVQVDGRDGFRKCHLETIAPAQAARALLNSAPAYCFLN